MLLWIMGVGFDNTHIVSGNWNVSRVIQRLYGWIYKTLRLSPVVNIVLWLWLRDCILWVANFRFPFYEICVQNQWGHKCWDPAEDFETGDSGWITVRMEYLLVFQYWYSELCVENRWGGGRKNCFVNFLFLVVLELSVNERWFGGAKSLI